MELAVPEEDKGEEDPILNIERIAQVLNPKIEIDVGRNKE